MGGSCTCSAASDDVLDPDADRARTARSRPSCVARTLSRLGPTCLPARALPQALDAHFSHPATMRCSVDARRRRDEATARQRTSARRPKARHAVYRTARRMHASLWIGRRPGDLVRAPPWKRVARARAVRMRKHVGTQAQHRTPSRRRPSHFQSPAPPFAGCASSCTAAPAPERRTPATWSCPG